MISGFNSGLYLYVTLFKSLYLVWLKIKLLLNFNWNNLKRINYIRYCFLIKIFCRHYTWFLFFFFCNNIAKYFQDCEAIWNKRDNDVKALCKKLDIEMIEKVSHTLWDPFDIIDANGGMAPLTYEMFVVSLFLT